MPVLEKQVVAQILRYLKSLGPDCCWYMRTEGGRFGRRGLPDIIGTFEGTFFAIEVKRPGGQATELQLHELKKISDAGGMAGVAHCVDDVKNILNL